MRLIDADDVIKSLMDMIYYDDEGHTIHDYEDRLAIVKGFVDSVSTVDAEPVRHGKWVGAESQCGIGCPFCGTPVDDFCVSIDYINLIYEPNYCPNCGAKMDGERKDNETD